MSGRGSYQTRPKPNFVLKMRELGYMVEAQQETISMLMGLTASMAEEIDLLRERVKLIEGRQPAVFVG